MGTPLSAWRSEHHHGHWRLEMQASKTTEQQQHNKLPEQPSESN
jgi:heme-degrading monooxygenase HmoA